MNRKGFTLIELIATLVILGIVLGITILGVNKIFENTKNKTEDVFVSTIRDALDIYLTSKSARGLSFDTVCDKNLDKSFGSVKVYKTSVTFLDVINSEYKPLTQEDLVNPGNEAVSCSDASNITFDVYRDENYVYYYSVNKSSFGCLKNDGVISNLPKGFEC